MVLNYIWIAFFLIAFVIACIKLVFLGDTEVFPAIMNSTFETAKTGFEISLGLTGVLSLWLGIMKIGEKGGLIQAMARLLSPVLTRLFPEIPRNHPVFGNIFMNIAANMLGLDNAATPLGLKAMERLQELNVKKDTASNSMIMFLVLNTSGLTIIPVSILVYRAQMGAAQPTDVFIPILLATFFSTLAGIVVTSIYQRINLFQPVLLAVLGGMSLFVAALIWGVGQLSSASLDLWGTNVANILLFSIITMFLVSGMRAKINVYDAFIEGAKDGFQTAVRIIPYLIAILVSIGVFRASGAMDIVSGLLMPMTRKFGIPSSLINFALLRPVSGSGSLALARDIFKTEGPDSFVSFVTSVMMGSTETTFYTLAVYFGSVGIRKTRYAPACSLFADCVSFVMSFIVVKMMFA